MITWAYIAGFLDGDGWITKTVAKSGRPIYVAGLTQSEQCHHFMVDILKFLVDNNINAKLYIRNKHNWKSKLKMVNIMVKEQESLLNFLSNIEPYILIKKQLCIDAKIYLEDRISFRKLKPIAATCAKSWSELECNTLKSLVDSGKSNIEISHIMDRGTQSVASKIFKLKLRVS